MGLSMLVAGSTPESLLFASIFPFQGAQILRISEWALAIALFSFFFVENYQQTYPRIHPLQSGNSFGQKNHSHSTRFRELLSLPAKIF